MSVRRPLLATALLATAAAVAVSVPVTAAGAAPPAGVPGPVPAVHHAIQQYADIEVARDAGYVQVSDCVQHPLLGGMGIHLQHPEFSQPGPVTPSKPSILLYLPGENGDYELLGAEFWQPDVQQPVPHLGGQRFDGPIEGHSGMPDHYALHVWTEVANPAGVFAPFNPRVSCD